MTEALQPTEGLKSALLTFRHPVGPIAQSTCDIQYAYCYIHSVCERIDKTRVHQDQLY